MPTTLAVLLVNYNTKAHIAATVPALLKDLADAPFISQISVVDNASGDDLGGLAATFDASVEFHQSPVNGGFGAGHNLLARFTVADLLCIVNPDIALPQPRTLERLVQRFDDPSIAVVGPRLITEEQRTQRWDHGELRGFRARVANGAGHAHWQERAAPTDVAWVSGAFLLIRRETFEAVGRFDERFFLYKEEEDLCLRVRQYGGRVLYDPTVSVEHVGSVVADRETQMAPSVAYYAQKHLPGWRRHPLDFLYRHVTRRF